MAWFPSASINGTFHCMTWRVQYFYFDIQFQNLIVFAEMNSKSGLAFGP
jgi:hypothetical protein